VNDRLAQPSSKIQIAHRTVVMWQSDTSVADTAMKNSEAGAMAHSGGKAGIMVGPASRSTQQYGRANTDQSRINQSSAGTTECIKRCK